MFNVTEDEWARRTRCRQWPQWLREAGFIEQVQKRVAALFVGGSSKNSPETLAIHEKSRTT